MSYLNAVVIKIHCLISFKVLWIWTFCNNFLCVSIWDVSANLRWCLNKWYTFDVPSNIVLIGSIISVPILTSMSLLIHLGRDWSFRSHAGNILLHQRVFDREVGASPGRADVKYKIKSITMLVQNKYLNSRNLKVLKVRKSPGSCYYIW